MEPRPNRTAKSNDVPLMWTRPAELAEPPRRPSGYSRGGYPTDPTGHEAGVDWLRMLFWLLAVPVSALLSLGGIVLILRFFFRLATS